jgi:hypothetical protein
MSIALDAAFPKKGCSYCIWAKSTWGNETATVAFSFLPAASQLKGSRLSGESVANFFRWTYLRVTLMTGHI